MSEAAIIAAPVLMEGVRAGSVKAKAVYEHAVDVMTRELEHYDYEKVVTQGVAWTVAFFVGKIVYGIYWDLKNAAFNAKYPQYGVLDFVSGLGLYLMNPVFAFFLQPVTNQVADKLKDDKVASDAYKAEVLDDPVIQVGKFLFEENWFYIFVGVWVLIALLEKRRIDGLKRKRRKLMKLVTA